MNDYIIYTDSACDISPEKLNEWGVKFRSLTFVFNDSEKVYSNFDMPVNEFYRKMRAGGVAKTSAVNAEAFREAFAEELEVGRDVLYIGFSTGLSTTANSAQIAADELRDQYPDRKLITIDTLTASAGQGLVIYLAVQKKNEGKSIDEVADFVREVSPKMCHWFTVDDLVYLKRGGRISPTVALVGTVLGIKPILHVDDEGHLISVDKVRSRKGSLRALCSKYGELHVDPEIPVFISQADCYDEANSLGEMIKERYGVREVFIADIGPVIGAHAGPGTIA
ncbi:MAG: DegV family protein, partial [Oscillospiraceae bacterium]|nr:DegV family protein [Oscillospiraceae bacterium]